MFPHVDHAEEGDENQPHNSAYNSTSTTNQDVVTAQLAAMQQYESQGQSHIAPAQQPLPDDVTRRLDSLEKLVAEQRGAPPPHPHTNSIPHPLNANITLEPYPIFPSTLRGNARAWYYSFPPRSISSYSEMASAFATKFSNRRLIRKTTFEQMRVKQRDEESLKNYMSMFNDAVLEASSFNQAVGIAALIQGLQHERFRDSLIKHPTATFNEIKNKMDLRPPVPMSSSTVTRDHTRYCDFHQDHGHIMEQCNSLRSELENQAQKGMLNEYIQRTEQPKFVREQGPQPQGSRSAGKKQGVGYQQVPPPLPPPTRIIHMITGGLEAGVVTPHNDHLVTSVMINNYGIQRILVDIRSAPNIMYFHCFESLGLDPALLQRYDGPIYGFSNQPVQVEGVLTFNVAFGSDRTYVTPLEVARNYYITLVTRPQKGKDQTPETILQRVPNNQQVIGVDIVDNQPEDETKATPIEDVEEVQMNDKDPNRKTQIGTRLNPKERANQIAFLQTNKDVFAWISANMPGILTSVIKEEVDKLLQAGFIRRVDYCEWVANPVLVKKANGKWRMCIDYTNLNQACPKDCYPMPSIDKLVEAASGNERLSLLDAYSSYHQVPMAPEDEEKISFYTGDEIYCYVMMPFGLKNASATYQKMVTIVFRA
ncbi:hypothetical protein SLEP1_g48004 [Rubroshorea leprosula]|uniref:Retrotransposon gag domain-containing protein n=1 Tax=Rubroshorea leprosula TaxID=152421 RepID=A0AAV5LV79_9ROSI|nr:hypothetical protein SLEP1_g48004 [Rubroshorea leprosula]